jgi:hypothetical protein
VLARECVERASSASSSSRQTFGETRFELGDPVVANGVARLRRLKRKAIVGVMRAFGAYRVTGVPGRDVAHRGRSGPECCQSLSAGVAVANRASHRDARRIAGDRGGLSLDESAELGPLLGGFKHDESEARVVRGIPRHVAESGECQRLPVLGRGVRVKTVDQSRSNPASCVRGSDADLLDVGAPIDDVGEEIADWMVGSIDRNPRASVPNERLKVCGRQRLVSGDLGHADLCKCARRIALELTQGLELVPTRPPDPIHRPNVRISQPSVLHDSSVAKGNRPTRAAFRQ